MLDLKIETFLTVCKHMNFTKAANELHLSQSAVSQQIALLEDYYNTKLFLYENRILSLTKAGIYLRNTMESISNDSLRIKSIIKDLNNSPILRIGATLTIGNYYLPKKIIPLIKSSNRDYKIYLNDTKDILEFLDEGKIDIALIEGIYNKNNYESKVFYNDTINFVCNYKMNTSSIHKLEDTFKYTILLRENGSGTRTLFENSLIEKGYDINSYKHHIEVNSIQLIKDFLYENMGISVLYNSAIEEDLKNNKLQIIKLSDFEITHSFTAIWKKNSVFSKDYELLINAIINK